jgi:tetratricopeptide (TPR) repeat protein
MVDDDVAGAGRGPVMSHGLRRLLTLVFLLVGLLVVNSTYLAAITLLEYLTDQVRQDAFYLSMFLVHLALGLILIPPFLVFGTIHLRRARRRPNRPAVRAGVALFGTASLLLLSGLLLTRLGFFEVNDPQLRHAAYWLHVLSPFAALWLFVLHRLAGRALHWSTGLRWGAAAVGFATLTVGWNLLDRPAATPGAQPAFATTLIRTPGGRPLAAEQFMTDDFCAECHADIAADWRMSAHRLSSFNNPFYRFSVEETRKVSMARSGSVVKAQFCAGCHDVVPLVDGRFDDPGFAVDTDPTAHAGLTCTSCHAITRINSVRGNADFTLEPPVRYPFENSENALLRGLGKQLIKAKPAYHKRGFLKPLHASPAFCGSCHKAHVPMAVNDYKWLRGQNHYDSFMQSGVSGHRVDSFYYPRQATETCSACHMPLEASDDPAARDFDGSGTRKIHSHQFPAANTGLAHTLRLPEEAIAAHRRMLEGAARVDLFGMRETGAIDGRLHAPLDRADLVLVPGRRYLLEAVVRNLRVGHHLTQGTADSNELWLDVSVRAGDRLIGRSGGTGPDGAVDPWSFFLNAYVLTKDGARLDRRNGQDSFVALYDHQIAPGAATVVHYLLRIPEDVSGPVTIDAALRYRKFDTTYLRHVQGEAFTHNDLPVITLGSDRVRVPTRRAGAETPAIETQHGPALWERWNDYGIGLLLSGEARRSTLRQAEHAFRQVETLGRPDGPLNLARVYLKEGRVDDAAAALQRAAEHHPRFRPWTRAWLTALVDRENGHLARAAGTLQALLATRFGEAQARGFDFSRDYRARNLLGRTLYEQARQARGAALAQRRRALLEAALAEYQQVLSEDPENLSAHFNLALVWTDLGETTRADAHRALLAQYRADDHAVERAVAMHRRRHPAADHAAEPVAIYDLQRPAAYGLPGSAPENRGDRATAANGTNDEHDT